MIRHVTFGYLISMMSSCFNLAAKQQELSMSSASVVQWRTDYQNSEFLYR